MSFWGWNLQLGGSRRGGLLPAGYPSSTQLWLDASDTDTITDSSGTVSAWADKSGNGHVATPAGTGPTTNSDTINSNNVITFDGTSAGQGLGVSTLSITDDWTISMSVKVTSSVPGIQYILSPNGERGVFAEFGAQSDTWGFVPDANEDVLSAQSNLSQTDAHLLTVKKSGDLFFFYENGVYKGFSQSDDDCDFDANFLIGGRDSGTSIHLFGQILEIVVCDTALSDSQRTALESKMRENAGITFTLNEFSEDGLDFGIQSASEESAPIRLTGVAPAGETIQARIMDGASVEVDWHDIGTTTTNSVWEFKTDPVPRGDGYNAEVRLSSDTGNVLSMTRTFNVRDVIVTTGSSSIANAHGEFSDFVTEYQVHNGGIETPVLKAFARGGAEILETVDDTGHFYLYDGDLSSIQTWQDLQLGQRGQLLEDYLTEVGGEVTAIFDSSGGNDLNWFDDLEELRVWRIAQSRKYLFASTLAGRDIPFFQNEIGQRFNYSVGNTYADVRQQICYREQAEAIAIIDQVKKGARNWDLEIPPSDSVHKGEDSILMQRMARDAAKVLGYAPSLRTEACAIIGHAKTGAKQVTAYVELRGDATDITITPYSEDDTDPENIIITTPDKNARIANGSTVLTIEDLSKGSAVEGVIPVTFTTTEDINVDTLQFYYCYGTGHNDYGVTLFGGANTKEEVEAEIKKIIRDNGTKFDSKYFPALDRYDDPINGEKKGVVGFGSNDPGDTNINWWTNPSSAAPLDNLVLTDGTVSDYYIETDGGFSGTTSGTISTSGDTSDSLTNSTLQGTAVFGYGDRTFTLGGFNPDELVKCEFCGSRNLSGRNMQISINGGAVMPYTVNTNPQTILTFYGRADANGELEIFVDNDVNNGGAVLYICGISFEVAD